MSDLTRLRQKIETTITNELKPARERIRSASDSSSSELVKVREELLGARSDIAALESASPAELIRRGMTAKEAVAKSDDLAKTVKPMEERERALLGEMSRSQSNLKSDFNLIRRLLAPLTFEAEIVLQAEIAALLCAMIDGTQVDILYELEGGKFDRLFKSTIAAWILDSRHRAIRTAAEDKQFLAVADEILEEPIPKLMRNPAEFPHHPNSRLARTIKQVLTPQEEPEPAQAFASAANSR